MLEPSRRRFLTVLGVFFALASGLFSGLWMYYVRQAPQADLGALYGSELHALPISHVFEDSPAAQAGLRKGDRIVAVNRQPLTNLDIAFDALHRGEPGDIVLLTVEAPSGSEREVELVLVPFTREPEFSVWQGVVLQILGLFPLYFLPVAFVVLFLKISDRNAWLLALLFGSFVAGAHNLFVEAQIPPGWRGFARWYAGLLLHLGPAAFYYFFASFPSSSPLDRRLPWLKQALAAIALFVMLPPTLWGLMQGHSPENLALNTFLFHIRPFYAYPAYLLGFVSLVLNARSAETAEAKKKLRVILWGAILGLTPTLLLGLWALLTVEQASEVPDLFDLIPFWLWAGAVGALLLIPLSFAYAVVKHRVMGITLMLKMGARYMLVKRGFVVLLMVLAWEITVLFISSSAQWFGSHTELATRLSVTLGVGFGVALVWTGATLHRRVARRIDRAFFHSTYDTGRILQQLAEGIRGLDDRDQLADVLQSQVRDALHPRSMSIYLQTPGGQFAWAAGNGERNPATLSADDSLLQRAAQSGRPIDIPPASLGGGIEKGGIARLAAHALVPILNRERKAVGCIILGERLSEQPYSKEDKKLLRLVGDQAGIALEGILLARQMAERLEKERLSEREMEIARQVQARLFPQHQPPLNTLDYVGRCIPTRAVGGDYYDFLKLGPGRLGLAVADISGKGISAALLMANLQANLRSQHASAVPDLLGLLQTVNRLFHESTEMHHYATFFFGDYDDAARRLRYANCGHNPPIILRADGAIDELPATASVLGMFDPWEVEVMEVPLHRGDCLVIFTDGIPEAMNDDGEEYGEERLRRAVRRHAGQSVAEMLDRIATEVQEFTGTVQEDDVTLVVARGR